MNRIIRHFLQIVLFAPLFLPLAACALSGKAIEGKVLEEGTNKPIPEAIVIARWSGHLATFAHGKTVCYYVLSTTTDENGIYRFSAWKREITDDWQNNVQPEAVIITVHKPGYEEYRPLGYVRAKEFKQYIRYLKPFTGTQEEKLKVIRTAGVSCGSAGESQKNLLPLYRTLYEEARALAVTKEDKAIVNNFLYKIDLIELPYQDAEKRDVERGDALRRE